MSKTAIILGATGLTGGFVLEKLCADKRYSTIKVFSRKSVNIVDPKIIEYIGDLFELEKLKKDFIGHEVFCCIGTTTKKTPDKTVYKKIDYGIPLATAKLCVENEIDTFLVISSLGADTKSSVFYSRTKGEMERDVIKEDILRTYILRPSIIIGNRSEKRFGESIGVGLIQLLRFILVGKLKKYRAIEAETIARTMIYLANELPNLSLIDSDKIQEIALG